MLQNKCIYCDPYNGLAHTEMAEDEWLARFSDKIYGFLGRKFPGVIFGLEKNLKTAFLKTMLMVNVLKEIDVLDNDGSLYNRSLVFAKAARGRGLAIKALKLLGKKETNLFSLVVGKKKIFFEGLPLVKTGHILTPSFDDKYIFKKILQDNGLSVAEGKAFHETEKAVVRARELGFPLVVKPLSGSLSKHTTCNITNEEGLRDAIRIVQMISRDFVVEKFISGDVYRVTVARGEILACCLREAPNVIGDGVHSIRELVEVKNRDPRRGEISKRNSTLHKINLGELAALLLSGRGFNFETIPEIGEKIYIHDKVVLACGADIHDKTDIVHPENKNMFSKLSLLLGGALAGIDFICEDISKPYYEQECAIIEANSLPYIDMHHFPVTGEPRDVAGRLVDMVMEDFQI